jgi:rubrerythrin
MNLQRSLNVAYLRKLASTREGRAHVLSQTADGESSGEARIFSEVLARVDDPELQRMVRRHAEDELRHERLFRERLAANGADPQTAPPESLRLVTALDRALGGILDRPIVDARGVLEAYCLLQALEERACASFGIFVDGFGPSDPASGAVFAEVLEDEKRHLKYCVAVARRYAASEAERLEVLAHMREVEAQVFRENQLRNMDYTLGRGWLGGWTFAWRIVQRLARTGQRPPAPAALAQA